MEKIKAITTLQNLKDKGACQTGYETLINYLGENYPPNKEINLLTILESNGVDHCLWSFRATTSDCSKQLRFIAADCAESVLYIYQNKYPDDNRPELAIKACRDLVNGETTAAAAAAYAAAAAAAYADAYAAYAAAADAYADAYAAYAAAAAAAAAADAYADAYAAYAAAAAAADAYADAYAAYAADAYAAAKQKELNKQSEIIKKYLKY